MVPDINIFYAQNAGHMTRVFLFTFIYIIFQFALSAAESGASEASSHSAGAAAHHAAAHHLV